MTVTIDQIKALREITGVPSMTCKKALEEAKGNQEKAVEFLRKKGAAKALERAKKTTGQGIIDAYVHSNKKIGVLLELGCETDFVAKNEDFQNLAHDIAMHIAALNPMCLTPEEVPKEIISKEKKIWKAQLKEEGKPENIWENIIKGKEKKFREENALLKQPFVKNPEITIEELIAEIIAKIGENVQVKRFVRFSL